MACVCVQALVRSKHINSYARGYALKLKEQQLKVGMSLMLEVEKVLQVGEMKYRISCTSPRKM